MKWYSNMGMSLKIDIFEKWSIPPENMGIEKSREKFVGVCSSATSVSASWQCQ
jgi:hypothetical protein